MKPLKSVLFACIMAVFAFTTFTKCSPLSNMGNLTPYEDMALTFTESKLKQIFKLEAINLQSDSIYLEKVCAYSDLQKIFPEKILQKFTSQGHAEVHNLKVHTKASWQYLADKQAVLIIFTRKKYKNYVNQNPKTSIGN
jgi:hypothetical protein